MFLITACLHLQVFSVFCSTQFNQPKSVCYGSLAAAVASSASAGGIVVGIEALSVVVGTFFGMLPLP